MNLCQTLEVSVSRDSQQQLIDQALDSRKRDNLPGGETTLTFFRTTFDCEGLTLLADQRPDLKGLFLMQSQVQDKGFEAINGFRELEELNLGDTKVTSEGILQIDPTLPIRELKISPLHLTQDCTAHLAKFKTLRTLDISRYVMMVDRESGRWPGPPVDKVILELAPLTDLTTLNMFGRILEGPGLAAVINMASLKQLALSESNLPAKAIALLGGMRNLTTLFLRNTALDDDAFESLSNLVNMEHIDVSSTKIGDRSIDVLLGYHKLQAIGFENVNVSAEAAARLLKIPTLKHLEIYIEGVSSAYWYHRAPSRENFRMEA